MSANETPAPEPARGVVAVTGGTGFVGAAAIDALLAAGYAVRALARSRQGPRDRVIWIRGDLADHAALAQLAEGARAFIHIAGVVNARDAAGFEAGNVAGMENALLAAKGAGIRRFVHVSSLSARAPELSDYGASKARGEDLVRASGLDWTVLRPPAIYGPHDTEMRELFRAAHRWRVVPVPGGARGVVPRTSLIHVGDLARLLVALIPSDAMTYQRSFEPDDGRPGGWAHVDLARAIGTAVSRRVRVVEISPAMLRVAARIDRLLRGGKAKLTPDRAGYMAHPDWVVDAAARPPEALWRPEIETEEGLSSTARFYRWARLL